MPSRFLSSDQRAKCGGYSEESVTEALQAEFFLDDNDKRIIESRHGEQHRLGYALQLCSVRHLGHFVKDLKEVPREITRHIGEQIGVTNPDEAISQYDNELTRKRHLASTGRKS